MSDQERGGRVLVAALALIIEGGRLLLVRRGGEPSRDAWSLPGGLVELGESIEEALVRGVYEETGLNIKPTGVAAITQLLPGDGRTGEPHHFIIICMRAVRVGGTARASGDVEALEWVPLKEVQGRRLARGLDSLLRTLALEGQGV